MIHVQKIEEGQDSDAMLLGSVQTWLTGIPQQRQTIISIVKTSKGYVTVTEDPEPPKEG
jgi:hypothetical protein